MASSLAGERFQLPSPSWLLPTAGVPRSDRASAKVWKPRDSSSDSSCVDGVSKERGA